MEDKIGRSGIRVSRGHHSSNKNVRGEMVFDASLWVLGVEDACKRQSKGGGRIIRYFRGEGRRKGRGQVSGGRDGAKGVEHERTKGTDEGERGSPIKGSAGHRWWCSGVHDTPHDVPAQSHFFKRSKTSPDWDICISEASPCRPDVCCCMHPHPH